MENNNSDDSSDFNGKLSNHEKASQIINKYAGTNSNAGNKRKIPAIIPNDDEYNKKRARNNVAVKKSREKAKTRIQETQSRVEQLSNENEELQTKVTLLSKELNVLRALFTNGGFTLPGDLPYLNNNSSGGGNSIPDHHLPHSPDSIESHSGNTSHYENTHPHSISQLNKSNYLSSKLEDSKIPPLRPMPRVINSTISKSIPPSSDQITSKSYSSYNSSSERDSVFTFSHKSSVPSYYKKDIKPSPMLVSPNSNSVSNVPSYPYSSTQSSLNFPTSSYKKMYETQHTSVIRNGPKVTEQSSVLNTLGKFCIVSDPENNGQVKIVPMSS